MPPSKKPPEFAGWLDEIELICDQEGLDLFLTAWMFSPNACCEFLESMPGVLQTLIARARWADQREGYIDRRRRVS